MCLCQREQDRKRKGGRPKPGAKLLDYQTQGTMEHNALIIGSWNIQGLRSIAFGLNSRNLDFIKEIRNTDILVLQGMVQLDAF